MLAVDPIQRPSAKTLLRHPFLSQDLLAFEINSEVSEVKMVRQISSLSEDLSDCDTTVTSVHNLHCVSLTTGDTVDRDCEVHEDNIDLNRHSMDSSFLDPSRRDQCEEPSKYKISDRLSVDQVDTLRLMTCGSARESHVKLGGFLFKPDFNTDSEPHPNLEGEPAEVRPKCCKHESVNAN
eukprot:1422388-Rhodomonas_salina.1